MAQPSGNLKNAALILICGFIIATPFLVMNELNERSATQEAINKTGLSVGYDVDNSYIFVNYTDVRNETREMDIIIQVDDYSSGLPKTVFESSVDTFPAFVTYEPEDRGLTYLVGTKVNKTSGVYSYSNSVTPKTNGIFGGFI